MRKVLYLLMLMTVLPAALVWAQYPANMEAFLEKLPAEAREQYTATMTNRVLYYDDYDGTFIFEAVGDKGGSAKLHLQMHGFYLRPILTLSQSKQGIIPEGEDYEDVYQFLPQSITATGHMNLTRHCVSSENTIFSNFSGSIGGQFNHPAPPNTESMDMSIPNWIMSASSMFLEDKLRFSFNVSSRKPSGGEALLSLDAYAFMDGVLTTEAGERDDRGSMLLTHKADGSEHVSIRTGKVVWRLPGPIVMNEDISLEDISLNYADSGQVVVDKCGPAYEQVSDQSWTVRYRLTVAAAKDIEAVFRAADEDAADWMPELGSVKASGTSGNESSSDQGDEVRSFELTLQDPGPDEVEAVRFTLEQVSRNPGIAVNAGNHLLCDLCPDCKAGKAPSIYFRETSFAHASGEPYPVRRSYVHYSQCPIDTMPDAFFSSRENPEGYELSDGESELLQYTTGLTAVVEDVSDETVPVKVTVKDGAASFLIKAEIRVAGLWYEAEAQGPGAESDEIHIRMPLDGNRDEIPDVWASKEGVGGPLQDIDSLPGNGAAGDGLTAFEEYRGIYCQGEFKRLSPNDKDVFVHDYSRQFESNLAEVEGLYKKQDVYMRRLRGSEMYEDVVNYQDGRYKGGDEYAVVVMALSQCPGLDFGRALGRAYVTPPTQHANTAVIHDTAGSHTGTATSLGELMDAEGTQLKASQTLTGTLAHEIGHNMNIPHHGEGDGFVMLTMIGSGGREVQEDFYVAVRGGEHSGERDCFMKYNCAERFLDMDFVPQSGVVLKAVEWLDKLQPFDEAAEYGAENHFCTTQQGSGICGNAPQGNCLGRLDVRSY